MCEWCECVWDSRRGICTYMYMCMEAGGQRPALSAIFCCHPPCFVCLFLWACLSLTDLGIPIMTVWLAREPKRSSCLTSPVLGLQVTATSPSFSNSDPGDQTQVLVITQQVHYWPSYLTPAPSYNIIPLKFMFSVHPFCPLPTESAWAMPYSSPMDPEASLS